MYGRHILYIDINVSLIFQLEWNININEYQRKNCRTFALLKFYSVKMLEECIEYKRNTENVQY